MEVRVNDTSLVAKRRLITTDNHLVPPPWLINELPERMRDVLEFHFGGYEERDGQRYLKAPGMNALMMSGAPSATHVGAVTDSLEPVVKALNTFAEVDCTAWFDPKGRLEDMQRENVVAAVLIGAPSVGLRRSPADVEAQIAYCRVVNDWQYDTYKDYFDVFATGIYLPFLDPAACVGELERCAAKGMRPGLLPDYIFDSPYKDPQWEPLWEAANALKMPLTMHISGLRNNPGSGGGTMGPSTVMAGFYSASCEMGHTLAEFALTGIFERHPDLHVIMTEGSAFWLAGLMQFVDHHWESRYGRMLLSRFGSRRLERPPSDYIKRQGHATFMYDPLAVRLRDVTGLNCLLWGNDYPHTEGTFPYSQEYVEQQFSGVPEEEVHQITFSNAANLFGFKV
jgi:predicted TIM-barrel fold metal-dependent hydrolase